MSDMILIEHYFVHFVCSCSTKCLFFMVFLTVHPGMILVNNQLDAQFFMYVYFYSLRVSGSRVPIIRITTVSR